MQLGRTMVPERIVFVYARLNQGRPCRHQGISEFGVFGTDLQYCRVVLARIHRNKAIGWTTATCTEYTVQLSHPLFGDVDVGSVLVRSLRKVGCYSH